MIGMLMIPKTMAYVAIAFIAYNTFYRCPVLDETSSTVVDKS